MKRHLFSAVALLVMIVFAFGSVDTSNVNTGGGPAPQTGSETDPEEARKAAAEAARKAEEEYEQNGLVLLRKTVKGTQGEFGGEITGTVVNRRNRKLTYSQITFNLYDESGAQVGTAVANINGLEPGGRWNFKASAFGTKFSTYKINELSGF